MGQGCFVRTKQKAKFWAHRGLRAALAAAAVILPSQEAAALWDDRLEVFAAERITSDDNVFRNATRESDTFNTTSLGFNLDLPVSRQRFLVGAAVHDNRYDKNSTLDNTGKEARGIWLWQIGNNLNGRMGYTYSEALANFSNFSGLRTRNILKANQTFIDARYLITPRIRLAGGVTDGEQRNSDIGRQTNDINISTAEASVSYVTPAGNSLGIAVRDEDGHLPNRQVVLASLIDNTYSQRGTGVIGEYIVSGQSRLSGRVDRVSRDYAQVSQRNYDGTTARAIYDWTPGGRFSLNAVVQKDLAVSEDIQTTLVLVKGFILRPAYAWTDRTTLSGVLDYSKRDYLSDPGIALTGANARSDKVRITGVTLAYRPLRNVTLLGTYQHEDRSSTFAPADYTANVLSASARIAF